MPKRSNPFQKLVLQIERQLADSGTTVEESAMLPDAHGELREIDVLLRVPAGMRELLVAIECRDHARNADAPWVEQIRGKYEFLSVDRKVAVARKGFSKAAVAKARIWNIETITLARASKIDWAAEVAQISAIEFEENGVQVVGEVVLSTVQKDTPLVWPQPHTELEILDRTGASLSLVKFLGLLFRSEFVSEKFHSLPYDPKGTAPIDLTFDFPRGIRARDANGVVHDLRRMRLPVVRIMRRGTVNLTHTSYSSVAVAMGDGQLGDSTLKVTLTQKPGHDLKGELTVLEDGEESVFELPGFAALGAAMRVRKKDG